MNPKTTAIKTQLNGRVLKLFLFLNQQSDPLKKRLQILADRAVSWEKDNPHIVRAICILPLLFNWFIGLHRDIYRPVAYRGFLLSSLFLLSSWIIYWIIDLFKVYVTEGFVIELIVFSAQAALSMVYIAVSLLLALREYRKQDAGIPPIDRLKVRLLETL